MKSKIGSTAALFRFEIKKLAASRKNWAVIAILCVTLFLFVAYNMQQERAERLEMAAESDFLVTWYGYKAAVYEDFYGQFGGESLRAYAEISRKRASCFEELAVALRNNDRGEILRVRAAYCTAQAEYGAWSLKYAEEDKLQQELADIPYTVSSAFVMALSPDYGGYRYYTAQADFYQNLLESGIEPVLSLYEMTGFHFLYRFMTTLFPAVVLVIAFLLLSDSMAAEKDSGTYKFLLLQPVSRAKIVAVKIVAGAVYAAAVVLVAMLCAFLITGCINGFGSPEYPVLIDPDGYTSLSAVPSTYYDDVSVMAYNGIYQDLNMKMDTAYTAFEMHGDGLHLGASPYSSQGQFSLTEPSAELSLTPIWLFLISLLPSLLVFFLLVASTAVCISAFSYNGILSLVLCAIAGICLIPTIQIAYSPFQAVNCGLLAAGLCGQTLLSSVLVALVTSAVLYLITSMGFRKKDIIC